MFFSDTKTERSLRQAVDVETLIDASHAAMRAPTNYLGLALGVYDLVVRQGLAARDPGPLRATPNERATHVLDELCGERRVVLIYQGLTPRAEEREFLKGNANDRLFGVLFKLGDPRGDKTFLLTPGDVGNMGQQAWAVQEIPEALIDALQLYPEPEPESEEAVEKDEPVAETKE